MNSSSAIAYFAMLAGGLSQAQDCSQLDPNLIYCPAPQSPLVTELSEGRVVVELTVTPDGSVSNAHILSSSGNSAWQSVVLKVAAQWRYKPTGKSVVKVVPFQMTVHE